MNESNSSLNDLRPETLVAAVFLTAVFGIIKKVLDDISEAHLRKARLEAYRQRRRWRKADVPKLREMQVSASAELRLHRIENAEGRGAAGRGVITRYRPMDVAIKAFFEFADELLSPDTLPHRRLALLKRTPFWPNIVEALYRGTYAHLRSNGVASPSETAEHHVGDRLGISAAMVRKLCTDIRQKRQADARQIAALSSNAFNIWNQTGSLIEPDTKLPLLIIENLTVKKAD